MAWMRVTMMHITAFVHFFCRFRSDKDVRSPADTTAENILSGGQQLPSGGHQIEIFSAVVPAGLRRDPIDWTERDCF